VAARKRKSDPLREVIEFAKRELRPYTAVLDYTVEAGVVSGALLILRPKNLPGIEHGIMLDIGTGGEVAVVWMHAGDNYAFDPTSEAWRAALGDAVEVRRDPSDTINLVTGDQSVAAWMRDAKGTAVVCRKGVIWRAVLKQVLSLWVHLLPVPAGRGVWPVVGAKTRFRSPKDRIGLDIYAVCEWLIARFDLKVAGKDIPDKTADVHDMDVNASILAHIGKMYAVNIENYLWRQLGECVQFVLGFAPLPGTCDGWTFRWRVSDHHLPPTLEADDPEIDDTGFAILAWEHVDWLEERIAATLAQYGGTVDWCRPPTTPSPAPPTASPDAGPLPVSPDAMQAYRQPVAGITTGRTTDQTAWPTVDISDDRIVIPSYVPGLYAEAGDCYDSGRGYVQAKLDSVPPVFVDYVMWSSNENGMIAPTFVLRDARRIYDHLLWWTGGEPAKWFSLVTVDIPTGYIITLWPDVMKFYDQLKFGADAKLRVVTVPLRFRGPHGSNWDAARSRLGTTTSVGFLDTSKLDLQNTSNTDFSTVLWIDGIPVAADDNLKKLVKHREDVALVTYNLDP
jgi:hypothetical protein